jgi:DHA1 family multidrug resistance protein-like MFS transporter
MTARPFELRLPEEQWRRNRLAINITAALVFAGFTFVMPFLPLYVRECGIEGEAAIASWTGFLITISPLLAAFLAPLWGRFGDRFGMKMMVERATLAMTLHWALFGFANSVYQLVALRTALGIFGGFGTISMAMLVSSTPKEEMSRSIGTLQTVQIVSAAVGPLVGGLLADWIGIRRTCLVSTACAVAALVMINRLYQEPSARTGAAADGGAAGRVGFLEAARIPSFPAMIAIMFLVSFVERSFAPVVPLYIERLGTVNHVAKTAGLIISLGLFAEAVSATVMGNRLRRVPARRLLLWRLSGGTLACLPMGLVWATSQLLVLRLVLGLLAGGCMVVVYTLGSQVIPAQTRATSFSFLSSAALLGGALGPVAAGFLTHVNIRAIFFFNSLIFLVLLGISWQFVRRPE